jgi:hypothetical protein
MNLKNKKVTINDLAVMVKNGFDEAQKDRGKIREEMKEGFSQVRQEMREGFLSVNARLDMLEKDIKEFVTRDEFEDLMGRVKYIEAKLGIESGK